MLFGSKRSGMLLILGLLFLSTPGRSLSAPAPQAAPPAADKMFGDNVKSVPALDARVTKVQFFESGRSDMELRSKRIYQTRFAQSSTRSVYTEIHLEYPPPRKGVDFIITLVCSRGNGTIFRIEEYKTRMDTDWNSSDHWIGMGHHGPGRWDPGTYKVDIHINGEKVAAASFEIYE